MTAPPSDVQTRADQAIADFMGETPPDAAVYAAAVLLNRAAAELYKRVRAAAVERRGSEDWGSWAGLQNVARAVVLQSSTARDNAAALVGRKR